MSDKTDTKRVLMGRFGAAHGLRGQVRLQSFTADPEQIADYSPLFTKSGEALTITKVRPQKNMLVATLEGVTNRNQAELLNGVELFIPRDRLVETEDEDEFFYTDLVGLETRTTNGEKHGRILAVANYGADDVLEIRLADTGKIEVFPFTKAVVPDIFIADGYVTICPPDEVVGEDR